MGAVKRQLGCAHPTKIPHHQFIGVSTDELFSMMIMQNNAKNEIS